MNSKTDNRLALLIPAYNAEKFLPRLFACVKGQTEPFDEVLVYDDCSTDGTADIARQLGAKLIRGSVNKGCSAGKTALLTETECGWVHFHDADDLIDPLFVSVARSWIERGDADVVAFGCDERWEETGEMIGSNIPDDAAVSSDAIGYTIDHKINAISGLYRREAVLKVGGFDLDPDVLYNEDQAFHARLAQAGLAFRADPRVLVTNLRRNNSMWTANQARCIRAHLHVLQKILAGPHKPEHREKIARELWLTAAGAASHLDWDTADAAARLAANVGSTEDIPAGTIFRKMAALSPRAALRVREVSMRLTRPQLRRDYPAWRLDGFLG